MSSTYYVLCLSHDPATRTQSEFTNHGEAAQAIKDGIEGHARCDLLIERVSGAPVEYACPPRDDRKVGPHCHHRDVRWIDTEWLRLLGRAQQSTDPRLQEVLVQERFYCWPVDRVHRLRVALDIGDEARERP
ncbi:hypothetical protein ABZ154_15675 [Streptomyces sp. NPDC006261]|uniref:hypothetical protein n=1 Tax=Streptomyces sp. NPDC006261 TaxID=3156739 RepID=UPI00339F9C01